MDIPCLQADDQRISADLFQSAGQRIQPNPSLIISRNDNASCLAQAEEPQRHIDCLMAFFPNYHGDIRGIAQPVVLDIPAHAA